MTRRLTLQVCSTCGGALDGRTCVNGHNAYPAKEVEVVPRDQVAAGRDGGSLMFEWLELEGLRLLYEAMQELTPDIDWTYTLTIEHGSPWIRVSMAPGPATLDRLAEVREQIFGDGSTGTACTDLAWREAVGRANALHVAIWRRTGVVYRVDGGAVEDDPWLKPETTVET